MLALDQIANLYGEPMALLIQCCRVHFKTEPIEGLNERIAKMGEEKIEGVLKKVQLLSRLHRIRPVVYRALLNANVSIEFKTALKNELHSITLQNFEIAKETERIVKKLTTVGITAIPYKGVAFSKQFYGDISMRESTDIDLAIDASDLLAIQPQFEEDDYAIAAGMENPVNASTTYYTENKDLCFDKVTSNHQFHVELHWMVTHPRYQAPTNLNKINIAETVESELGGTSLRFLEPTEHLRATLLHHLLHDGMEYLKLLVDITQAQAVIKRSPQEAEKLNNQDVKITLLNKKIAELEQHYYVAPILQAIEELFGIEQINSIQTKTSIKESVIDYCLRSNIGRYQRHRPLSLLGHYIRSLHNRVRFIKNKKDQHRFQISYIHSLIKPGLGEREWIPLPQFLHGLYYLIRPLRILLRRKEN
jgi:hypothetical protein